MQEGNLTINFDPDDETYIYYKIKVNIRYPFFY